MTLAQLQAQLALVTNAINGTLCDNYAEMSEQDRRIRALPISELFAMQTALQFQVARMSGGGFGTVAFYDGRY